MGRIRTVTYPTVATVAAIGMAAVLAGCAQVGPHSDPAAPSPGRSTPTPAPIQTTDAPPLGLDVRYIDEDGEFKVLRVHDFPR